jgi:cell division septum initiation protein DivIVA
VINFRYHIVSLTAVFLALAIGLVVGTAALNGPVADNLSHQVTQISRTNQQLRDQVDNLEKEIGQKEQFATEAAPMLLADKLAGRQVLVVSMQKSSKYVPDVLTDLGLAGAKVTGQVEIEDSFVVPSNSATLLDTAETSISSTSISGLPTNSDGVESSSALLAAILMNHAPTVPSGVRQTVLQAYQTANYITVTGTVTGPAEAVVLIAGPPYVDQSASQENANMITIIDQFEKAGPIVVGAAAAAGSGNVVGAVTGDAALNKTVSTVDNIDTPQGQIAAVLALNERIVTGNAGHYGVASSASSLLPKTLQ